MTERRALLSVRKIDSASIYDPLSVRIGRVDELFLDPFAGRVRFALASFDIPEIEGESLPLPWEALHYNASSGGFFSYVTRTQLLNGPRFDEAAAQTEEWEENLRAYYNVRARDR